MVSQLSKHKLIAAESSSLVYSHHTRKQAVICTNTYINKIKKKYNFLLQNIKDLRCFPSLGNKPGNLYAELVGHSLSSTFTKTNHTQCNINSGIKRPRSSSSFIRRNRLIWLFLSSIISFQMSNALAADLGLRPAIHPKPQNTEIVDVYVPPPPPPKWTGYYGGLNIGAGWGATSYNWNAWYEDSLFGGTSNNLRYGSGISLGIVGGGQIGYNLEIPGLKVAGKGFLAGVEADFQGTTMGGNSTRDGWLVNVNNGGTTFIPTQVNGSLYVPGFGTARGRFGVLMAPTFLLYGTAGFAYAGISRSGAGFNLATVQTGWSVGGGMEFLLSPSWSMKMEYLYANVGGTLPKYINNYGPTVYPIGNNSAWNSVRLGLNYHLNFNPFPFILNVNVGTNDPVTPQKSSPVISSKY